MKYFPRDPKRQKQWAENLGRPNFVPTRSSVLCEKHFTPEMWENTREDCSKKLKPNAVPTIFEGKFINQGDSQISLEKGVDKNSDDSEEPTFPKRCKVFQSNNYADTKKAVTPILVDTTVVQGPELIISEEKITAEQTALLAQNYAIMLVPRAIPLDPIKMLQNETNGQQQSLLQPTPIALAPASNGVFQITTALPFTGITMVDSADNQNMMDNKVVDISRDTNGRQRNLSSESPQIKFNDDNGTELTEELYIVCDSERSELNENGESELSNDGKVALLETDGDGDSDDPESIIKDSKALSKLNKKDIVEQYIKKLNKLRGTVDQYHTKLRLAKEEIRILANRVEEKHYEKLINHIFNDDQIRALGQAIKGKSLTNMKWSDDTIAKSSKLKTTCGIKGYKELLSQNLPYPSIQTLQRAIAVIAEPKNTS